MYNIPAKRARLDDEESEQQTKTSGIVMNQRISIQILDIQLWLCRQLSSLTFTEPVCTVYNPIEYAGILYCQYVQRFCDTSKPILVLGMNPGPWGMAQTGVPFGEVAVVKEWLQLVGDVSKPKNEHSLRPVSGLDCHRSEVSGRKLWGLIRKLSGEHTCPETALSYIFVHNFCPLLFLKNSGCNITPAELKAKDRHQLFNLCNEALRSTVSVLECRVVLGIGKFAESRASAALQHLVDRITICSIPHPSPRNVSCRQNWESLCIDKITELGLLPYFQHEAQSTGAG